MRQRRSLATLPPMYRIRRSIDVDFAHHVRGHDGPCVNIHGHTWKFEVDLEAETLDPQGFVIDFHDLIGQVLQPCHTLLDHALAVGVETYEESRAALEALGAQLVPAPGTPEPMTLGGARTEHPGGMRVVVFPFNPTSERLARWLYELADSRLSDDRVRVCCGRVFETLLPVQSVAEYGPLTRGS